MNKWISVNERLPEINKKVLVIEEICPAATFGMLVRDEDTKKISWSTNMAEEWSYVTHWQPLPEIDV